MKLGDLNCLVALNRMERAKRTRKGERRGERGGGWSIGDEKKEKQESQVIIGK